MSSRPDTPDHFYWGILPTADGEEYATAGQIAELTCESGYGIKAKQSLISPVECNEDGAWTFETDVCEGEFHTVEYYSSMPRLQFR